MPKTIRETPILSGDIKELIRCRFFETPRVSVLGKQTYSMDPRRVLHSQWPASCPHNSIETEYLDFDGNIQIRKESGKHSDGWGQTKNYSDGKLVENIEDLFFDFLRIADEIRPKVIIAENVKGLTIGEAKEMLNQILNRFEEIGYNVSYKVLDSRYYGVSQTRTRVIFIGVRQDIAEKVGLNFMSIQNVFPPASNVIIPLKDALIDLVYDDAEVQSLTEKFSRTAYWIQNGQ